MGRGKEEGALSGILPGQLWLRSGEEDGAWRRTRYREPDGLPHPTANPLARVPISFPPRVRGRASPADRDSLRGSLGQVLPSESPKTWQPSRHPCLYLQGGLGAASGPRGGPRVRGLREEGVGGSGRGGRRRGPHRRVSASLCGPPSPLPEWAGGRGGGTGAAGGARRGGASTLLFPQPRPRPARAPPGPRAQPSLYVGLLPWDPL